MISLETLMQYIEDDQNGYLYAVNPKREYEIRYSKVADDLGDEGWGYKAGRLMDYIPFARSNVVPFLSFHNIDFVHFNNSLIQQISSLVFEHHVKLDQAVKLFGEDDVREMVEEHNRFHTNLMEAISSTLGRTKFKVVK